MKFKVGAIALVLLMAAAFSYTSFAGALADADGDLVPDGFDNCLNKANGPAGPSDQIDTDGDGYGNACDADFDQSGSVGLPDFNTLAATFLLSSGSPGYNAQVDCDGTNSIGLPDFNCLAAGFLLPPGPSGLACANLVGTPCP